jgi:glycerol-3-phosphate dehydrogenase
METKDLIVIGGGINGAGIAVDAAGRGLSVLMLEANDLACATSSASSKLIHGGLRYLEHYEFRLVSEALAEREVLLKMAPHLAIPMRFRLPHRPHLRPAWMIRIGLFMYDHLGKRTSLPVRKVCVLAQNRSLSLKSCADSNIPTAGWTMRVWCWRMRRWWRRKAAR